MFPFRLDDLTLKQLILSKLRLTNVLSYGVKTRMKAVESSDSILQSEQSVDMIAYNNSWQLKSSVIYNVGNYTNHDLNATVFASQVITASFAALFYLVVLVLGSISICFKSLVKLISSHSTFILFLIGAIMLTVNVFTTSANKKIMLYLRIISAFVVGIAFVLFGAIRFFTKPTRPPTLSEHEPSMGLVVTMITIPLNTIEIMMMLGAQASKNETSHVLKDLWPLLLTDDAIFIIQKFIQAGVYIWLRNTKPCESYKENAQFYFKTLAFFNFIQWVDTQVNVESDFHLNEARAVYGGWFDVLKAVYTGLMIDFRLLCSLLFLEHSIQIQTETEAGDFENNEWKSAARMTSMTSSDRQRRNAGFLIGFCCFLAPFFSAVQYVSKLHLPVCVRAIANFLNSICIAASGTVLLLKNSLGFDKKDKESMSVKIMVSAPETSYCLF